MATSGTHHAEAAMKLHTVSLLLSLSLVAAVQARATILPDACGDDKVKFDVTEQKDQPAPAPPDAGKAQIVLIENNNQMVTPFSYATVRFGMDGAWVGANKGDSYFTVAAEPGVHHLCVSWQSAISKVKKSIDVASFTAEPGKVYYFAAQITMPGGGGTYVPPAGPNGGGGYVQGGASNIFFSLAQLNEDEGKYRVKAWKKATWKSR
jgi:hypothetical protein